MKYLSRIEKSPFRKGEYIGYCGGAQRIRREGNGWQCYSLASQMGRAVYVSAPTLEALNAKLEILANP